MPKRRTTKKTSVKPKALVDKNLNSSFSDDKEEQMTMILGEFDSNVTAAVIELKKAMKNAVIALNKKRDATISAIPSELRHLTIKEFQEMGGTFEKALGSIKKVNTAEKTSTTTKEVKHRLKLLDELKAIQCDGPSSKTTKPEDDENEDVAELHTVQTAVRKGQRRRLKSTLRTPAITPKFDPNLPATPDNIRREKPGEKLMSLAGTPVQRNRVAKQQIEQTLRDCGLTPKKIERVFGTLSDAISLE